MRQWKIEEQAWLAVCLFAGGTNQRLDDFKGYIEARLGKPSHLLEGDKLRQFLENNKKVGYQGDWWWLQAALVANGCHQLKVHRLLAFKVSLRKASRAQLGTQAFSLSMWQAGCMATSVWSSATETGLTSISQLLPVNQGLVHPPQVKQFPTNARMHSRT